MASNQERLSRERVAALQRDWTRADLERQQVRKWKIGDVYAPHDLSGTEAAKWLKLRRRGKPNYDVMDQLGINPIHHYKVSSGTKRGHEELCPLSQRLTVIGQNFSIMSEYMTEMGRIKHRRETSLRPVNQRRMAKAIRRAIGIGLMPGVHRHPEILRLEMSQRRRFR
jgi:small subunit ribosomal protein S18